MTDLAAIYRLHKDGYFYEVSLDEDGMVVVTYSEWSRDEVSSSIAVAPTDLLDFINMLNLFAQTNKIKGEET